MTNHTPLHWSDKPYHSLDFHLKQCFGEKVYKLALDGGFTCPNRDGTLDNRGCIFCSEGGSGEFAGSPTSSITQQLEQGMALVSQKYKGHSYIAYFQAYTSTYASVEQLDALYEEALNHPQVVALAVATRPDCLPPEVIALLGRLNQIKPVWIELGLQTIHPKTAAQIRRGYPLECFETALRQLNEANLEVVVHTILGLPGESKEDILNTIRYLANTNIQGIKLSLLHLLKYTDLAKLYETNPFHILTQEEYVDLLICCIELLPPQIVVHRLTGDGPRALLIEPTWSLNKKAVLNDIQRTFINRQTWQGRCCVKP